MALYALPRLRLLPDGAAAASHEADAGARRLRACALAQALALGAVLSLGLPEANANDSTAMACPY